MSLTTLTAAQLSTLTTELSGDPLALNYASLLASNSWAAITTLINDPTNAKVIAAGKVFVGPVMFNGLLGNINAAEFAALTTNQLLQLLICICAGQLNSSDSNTRSLVAGIFPASPGTTRAALNAAVQRNGSRAEQVLGINVIPTADDCAACFGKRA